jgi:DNA-binding NtrC family response regulator
LSEVGVCDNTWNAPAEKLAVVEPDPLIGALSTDFRDLREHLRRLGPPQNTLLLTGEPGTGKTHLARLVHELSPACDEPFLAVDCGALSADHLERELFGHVNGAVPGADRDRRGKLAAAGKGTLLLDQVNALASALQAKLLRAVDQRGVETAGTDASRVLRARLVATSDVSLAAEVAAGRFRADLLSRLRVVSFYLPPLRERRAAVAPLARKLLAAFAARSRPDLRRLTPEAMQALEAYPWPGNIRQLRNVIERAATLCPGPDVQLCDLPEAVRSPL